MQKEIFEQPTVNVADARPISAPVGSFRSATADRFRPVGNAGLTIVACDIAFYAGTLTKAAMAPVAMKALMFRSKRLLLAASSWTGRTCARRRYAGGSSACCSRSGLCSKTSMGRPALSRARSPLSAMRGCRSPCQRPDIRRAERHSSPGPRPCVVRVARRQQEDVAANLLVADGMELGVAAAFGDDDT